jgi:hypothetical protein
MNFKTRSKTHNQIQDLLNIKHLGPTALPESRLELASGQIQVEAALFVLSACNDLSIVQSLQLSPLQRTEFSNNQGVHE